MKLPKILLNHILLVWVIGVQGACSIIESRLLRPCRVSLSGAKAPFKLKRPPLLINVNSSRNLLSPPVHSIVPLPTLLKDRKFPNPLDKNKLPDCRVSTDPDSMEPPSINIIPSDMLIEFVIISPLLAARIVLSLVAKLMELAVILPPKIACRCPWPVVP